MSDAAAAPPPPPAPPSPPQWGIISSVPRVVDDKDDDDFLLCIDDFHFDILPPPSISHFTLPRRICPMEMTTENFPNTVSIDPLGLFLFYIPRSPDLTVLLPHKGAVETVPYPSSPVPVLANTGIISCHGFSRSGDYAICELLVHSSDCATLRCYCRESKKWTASAELQCDGVLREDWGMFGCAISHNKKIWWIDLRYGIITCDPFAEGFMAKQRDPFVELDKLRFIPLPGPAVAAESQEDLAKLRCVMVCNEKLRYVLIQPCAPDVQGPLVSMWTLDDPDAALWSLQYSFSLSEVPSIPHSLGDVTPKLALIHPLDPNVLYFFKNGWIFAVNVLSMKVIHYEQHSMVYPPEQHQCSRFVYAYEPRRKELAGVPNCAAPSVSQHDPMSSAHQQQLPQQENPSAGIETMGKIAESYKGKNISYVDVGMFSQSRVLRDNPTPSTHGQQKAQQGSGNGCTEAVGNTVENHGGKLITPVNFCPQTLLSESAIHLFNSAEDLRSSVDGSTSEWLANEQAWAMLKNPSVFQVKGVDDVTEDMFRADGSCLLASHNLLQKIHPTDYKYSTRKDQLIEKSNALKGTKLCQHTMKGNVWERRRLSIQGDDAFSVIQWRLRLKRADGGQTRRRGCEELPSKMVHSSGLAPAKPDAPSRTHDVEAGASGDAEAGLTMNERMNKLEAGQHKITQMLERMDKKIDRLLTTAPSQPPSASAQDRRPPILVEASNRDDADHRRIHRT